MILHNIHVFKPQGAHNLAEEGESNRVNKGTNSSPVVISFILREFTGKAAAYKSCVTL